MPLLKPPRGILLNRSHPLSRELKTCILANEGGGSKVFNYAGPESGWLGDFTSGVSWQPASEGTSLLFPGPDIVKLKLWDGGGKVTLFARVKFDNAIGSIEQVCAADSNVSNLRTFQFRRSSAGKLQFVVFVNNTAYTQTGTTTLTTGVWWTVAAVNDGANAYVYVNGQSDASALSTGNMDTDAAAWAIGGRPRDVTWSDVGEPLNGQVAFVMRWDRILTAQEIASLYCEPFAMFERASGRGLLYTLPSVIWIAGSAAAQSATSATLRQLCHIAGSALAQSQGSALCKITRKVSATAAGTAYLHGILTVSGHLPWFTGSLEIERPWQREVLFNCVSANAFKLGTALTGGWFWVRVSGCSALYRGADMDRIDWTNVLAVAAQDACEIQPPGYLLHNSNSTYFYVVRHFNNCGYREYTLSAAVKVSIGADGELTRPQPNNIFCSKTEQMDGNKIHLVWFYCPLEQESKPERFKIYWDGRTGQVNYDNPVATINYEGRKYYSYETGALEAGRYLFAIRAEDAHGVENNSLSRSRIDLRTTTPDPITILSAVTI